MRGRIEKVTGLRTSLLLTNTHLDETTHELIGADASQHVFQKTAKGLVSRVPVLFLSSRFIPRPDTKSVLHQAGPGTVLRSNEEIVGYCLPPIREKIPAEGFSTPDTGFIESLCGGTTVDVEVSSFSPSSVWDIIRNNESVLVDDFQILAGDYPKDAELPSGVFEPGRENIRVSSDIVVGPHVVLDASRGPILLETGVKLRPFVHVEGPVYVGRGSTITSGSILKSGTTIGPVCRIGGEIECSIFQGYSNKAHVGFLGHSLVGEWVNLGAGTTNSDLKNNYHSIRIAIGETVYDTGMVKMGTLIGDHVKTGIGTLIDTGGVLATGCNVFGGGVQPKFIPPFTWGGNGRYEVYRLEQFLETASEVMKRREVTMSESQRKVLETVFSLTENGRTEWLSRRE